MKRMSDFIEEKLLIELRDAVQGVADSYKFSWGQINDQKELYERLNLPFGAHTAYNLIKGHYVGRPSVIKALDHFNIEFTWTRGYLEKVLEVGNGL